MSDLRDVLARLGLSQYFEAFVAEGFDSWETVLDITESDLSQLNVKLGHRRKLQRAIAESRGQSAERPLPVALRRATSAEGSYRSDDSGPENKSKQGGASATSTTGLSVKRKYRRHPKSDEYAPERPPSAYVIFSNQVRESLKGHDLSFTEIAKVVGERWQVLPSSERETYERQASGAKEKYYAELAEYKKTPHFEAYQKYLEEFRAKHAPPTKGPSRLPAAPSNSSKPTSPTTVPLPGIQSPRSSDYYPPMSASPRAATLSQDFARESRSSTDASLPYHPAGLPDSHWQPAFTQFPSYPYPMHYQPQVERSSRRPLLRDGARLPGLTHDDTTLSSESSQSNYGYPLTNQPPLADPGKSSRILPQPLPSILPSPPSSDHFPIASIPTHVQQAQDYRTQGSLAVLVRAGELASRAPENEPMDEDASP